MRTNIQWSNQFNQCKNNFVDLFSIHNVGLMTDLYLIFAIKDLCESPWGATGQPVKSWFQNFSENISIATFWATLGSFGPL